MSKLFKNDDSESESSSKEEEFKINNDYAKNYDNWRKKEELHKLQARYGENAEDLLRSDEESSDSSEDDEGEEIPEEFEKCFYKTLACLKNKDPRIYDKETQFFKEAEIKKTDNETQSNKKKEKSLFLRDYERHLIVDRGGKLSDSEDEDIKSKVHRGQTYVQEQQEIKESFKKALQEEDEDDFLLQPKTKTKEQKQKELEDYKEWLRGQKDDIDEDEKKDLKPLRDFWTDPKLDKNEKFLRDFVLNKRFLEHELEDAELDYDQKVHDSDENLSEDEHNVNQQEEFEHKYNFRFEENDPEFIKRYPRTMENSLRKKDTRRSQKRAEVKARKQEEKIKKQEELKQLKALKKKEIEEKIEKLKEITGNDDIPLNMIDLDEDFNPEDYDKKMSQIFNEKYYSEQVDEIKPEFPEIDEELGVESTWDNYDPITDEISQEDISYNEPHCEDPDFNMDADYDSKKNLQDELIDSTKKRKKRKRSKFAEVISKEKPKFDPSKHPSYKEYYDQYYALDYEDIIGDLPCRFKYRQVVPNDYGLTVEEILMADEKELNKWCSLKKALEYKPDYKELNDVKMYKQKAANENLKRKILKSLYRDQQEETENSTNNEQSSKKKRKRKNKNKTNIEDNVNEEFVTKTEPLASNSPQKMKIQNNADEKEKNTNNPIKNKKPKTKKDTDSNDPKNNEFKKTIQDTKEDEKQNVNCNDHVKSQKEKTNPETKRNSKKRKLTEEDNTNLNNEINKKSKKNKSLTEEKPNDQLEITDEASDKKTKKSNNSGGDSKNKKIKNNNKIKTGLSNKETKRLRYQQMKLKMKKVEEKTELDDISDKRLKAFAHNPKKFRNKQKYMKNK